MFYLIPQLLQISTGTKNSYVHLMIGGVLLVVFIIIKMSRSNYNNSSEKEPVSFASNDNVKQILEYSHSQAPSNPKNAIAGFNRVLELDPQNFEASGALGMLHFNTDNASSFKHLNHFYSNFIKADADINSAEFHDLALSFYMLGYHNNKNGNIEEALKLKTAAMHSQQFKREFASFRVQFSY